MIEIKPNTPLVENYNGVKIFLAGSIENGKAEPWQEKLVNIFKNKNITFFNPRRDNWNPNIIQSIDDPDFNQQVNWELDAIELSDIIIFYFDPTTISPITLLELGRVTSNYKESSQQVYVCCPEGYFRKGNIEIVCNREKVTLVNSFEDLVTLLDIAYCFSTG